MVCCQWCGHEIPEKEATWWDGQPQCPDPQDCPPKE
jgi:hypothetical protein